ncbi:MAG: sigma-70 family RNA polymerase sigma factor [Bacteroidota bacterium]
MNTISAQSQEDQDLLRGLLNADSRKIRTMYDLALPSVIDWVKNNQGTEADARDVFQEALLALYRRMKQKDFALSCSLKSYIRIICRNLWLSRLRKQQRVELKAPEDWATVQLDAAMVHQTERSEREQLFLERFDALGENCQKILRWFFDKVPMATIAERLNTSESYIKKRKFICKEKLIKSIREDGRFRELQ